jgi:glycosyltransferase involved in cell wall biosynthesis
MGPVLAVTVAARQPLHLMLSANAAWNIAHFRRPVVRVLTARGHRVTALAPTDAAVPALTQDGVRHLHLSMDNRGLNPLRDGALTLRLGRLFRRERPDVILSWTIKNNIFGALAARRLGIPFVPNVSGLGTAFLSGPLLRHLAEGLYRRAFRHLDTVFFQNEEDRALFLSRGLTRPAQSQLLPGSGIDLAHFAPAPPPPPGPTVFLFVGRLLRDKGVVEFIAAARNIRARHPDTQFHLLGAVAADNRSAITQAELDAWVDAGIVQHLGTRDDVRPAMAGAACIVLPSYREGAPRVLIEAGAMARPVIATDVPGCRQVVTDGVTGLLVRPRDTADLTAAMDRFLALPVRARDAMGRAARLRMEQAYDDRIVVDAYLAAIDRVTGGRV